MADYLAGMIAGTEGASRGADPVRGETWQPISDTGPGGQPMVESASVALGLQLTRPWSWDVLTGAQQDDLEAWLRGALRHEPAANNWYLFPLTVANFLESVGRGDDETHAAIGRALDLLEGWYRGDGWYSDGGGRAFDHYIGWAMHFYPVLFACLRDCSDTGAHAHVSADLRACLGDRLNEFLRSFTLTFDRNGSPLYQGRSLTYRVATVASVALGEVAGCSPLRPGQSRRLLSQTLRYFLEHGAVSGGVLSRGWHGEHLASLQPYSGPASPYWASKGFIGLLLPPEHPLWTATEERLDDEEVNVAHNIASVGWLIQRTGCDGIVRVHNHGSDHMMPEEADGGQPDPHYARFAYSTRTGNTALRNVPDNDVHVTIRKVPSVRRRIHPLGGGADWAASYHVPQFPVPAAISGGGPVGKGPVLPSSRIESLVVVRGSWEVRIHRFTGVPDGTAMTLSGWALAAGTPVGLQVSLQDGLSSAADGHPLAGDRPPCEPTRVMVCGSGLVSELTGIAGWSSARSSRAPQGTAYGEFAIVPELWGTMRPGLFVALARLTTSDETAPPAVSVSTGGVIVQWHDGVHQVEWAGDNPDVTWDSTAEGAL
jgi:hypothetical protein